MRYVCQRTKIFHTEEQTARRTDIQTGMTKLTVAFRNILQRHLIGGKFIIVYEQPTVGFVPNALSPLPQTLFL